MSEQPNLEALVHLAVQNYQDLPPIQLDESITPENFYLATPDRLAYALGWIVASQIVDARFLRSGIDVLPVFHPDAGWDRFLITRRVSAEAFKYQPANEFGMLLLDGPNAPLLTTPGGKTRLALGAALQEDPRATMRQVLDLIPSPAINTNESNTFKKHERAPHYPLYYRTVTELILEHPGLVAAREIYIDDEEIDGQYHPLYLHATDLTPTGDDRSAMNIATITYKWFQLQYGDLFCFFDRRGNRSIYRTDRSTWSRVRKQLNQEPDERVKPRIEGWLRLNGQEPDPEVD